MTRFELPFNLYLNVGRGDGWGVSRRTPEKPKRTSGRALGATRRRDIEPTVPEDRADVTARAERLVPLFSFLYNDFRGITIWLSPENISGQAIFYQKRYELCVENIRRILIQPLPLKGLNDSVNASSRLLHELLNNNITSFTNPDGRIVYISTILENLGDAGKTHRWGQGTIVDNENYPKEIVDIYRASFSIERRIS